MPKSKHKNATKEYILIQDRNNKERFSKTINANSSNLEYSNLELLIYKLENNNKKELNNKIEPNKEEAKQLINKNNSFYNFKQDNNAASSWLSYYSDTQTWLHCLGLVYQLHQQEVYYNRYKHPNVVQYCAVFLERIKNFEQLMPQFVSKNMKIVINSELVKEKKMHIFVTHDECTFYANDSHPSV
ncbi:15015_t:CDS:2 [Cetraspora pellucida]|uniref:15015_t:CDS:1 n=1 Tax=Cetraspora pellucida TaxID=1433469 RepID=A0A9N9HFE5_9GLOM|nr:15015_t:CDS:2 [Cetraspora pellucida]